MSIISALNWRYATKTFDPSKKINDQDLQTLIETLVLTPSSYGLQPWHFVIVSNPEIKSKLKSAAFNQSQVEDCSHIVVLCAKTNVDNQTVEDYINLTAKTNNSSVEDLSGFKNLLNGFVGGKNSEELLVWAKKQAYIALGFLLVGCAELQIDSCPMEGFDPQAFDEILGLKELGLTATLVCPVGYRGDDKYANAPKVRYSPEETVTLIK